MQDRIERTHFSRALRFSEYYPRENVREITITQRLDAVERAVEMTRIEEAISCSLLERLDPEHPSPQICALDFPSNLRAPLYLLVGGYYRQAILYLLNWLEMRSLGMHSGFVETEFSKYNH